MNQLLDAISSTRVINGRAECRILLVRSPRLSACASGRLLLLLLLLLLALSLPSPSFGFVPPKPGSDLEQSYEFVAEYRAKRNISYSYVPTSISPELCKHLTEVECEHADRSMAYQHERLERHKRQRILEPNSRFELNVLVLLMQFTDHATRNLPDPYEYQVLLNLRVAKYLGLNSYGTAKVWFDVHPWQMTDNTELYYSEGKSGRTTSMQKAFHPLLNALVAAGTDFSVYDKDNDGMIDNLLIIHSGYPAEVGGTDCTNGRPAKQRIWSHALAGVTQDHWSSSNGASAPMKSNAYTIASGLFDVCGSVPAQTGVITHEFMHAFAGVPDLYDTEKSADGSFTMSGKGGVGSLDIMANPYGVSGNEEDFPSHMCPWTKIRIGWVEPTVINDQVSADETATFILRPSESFPDVLRINLEGWFGNEYLLLENRQKQMFDINLFGSGLVIYHIDDGVDNQEARGFPGQDGFPDNAKHYRVAVSQKDGLYDLEKGVNRGDANDFFQVGDKLGPNTDGNTWPNTDTYGVMSGVYPTGVIVEVVAQNGKDLEIKVTIPSTLQSATMAAPIKEGQIQAGGDSDSIDMIDVISGQFQADWFRQDRTAGTGEQQGSDPASPGVGSVQARPNQEGETATDGNGGNGVPNPLGNLFSSNQKYSGTEEAVDAVPAKDSPSTNNSTGRPGVGDMASTSTSTSIVYNETEELFPSSGNVTLHPEPTAGSDGETLHNSNVSHLSTSVPTDPAAFGESTLPPTRANGNEDETSETFPGLPFTSSGWSRQACSYGLALLAASLALVPWLGS
jgi:M6 family metalloprotease-like protein